MVGEQQPVLAALAKRRHVHPPAIPEVRLHSARVSRRGLDGGHEASARLQRTIGADGAQLPGHERCGDAVAEQGGLAPEPTGIRALRLLGEIGRSVQRPQALQPGEDLLHQSRKTCVARPSLSVAVLCASLGASGCEALENFNKTKKELTGEAKYGAIAFDEDKGGWGYSYNQPTEEKAKEAATEKCSSCTVHLTWEGGCAALAQSETDKKVMSAKTGGTRATAEGAAKASCLSKKSGSCKVVVWACNSKDGK